MSDRTGFAFPVVAGEWRERGLTKRELFAAMAMQGILGNPSVSQKDHSMRGEDAVAQAALGVADALIAALKEATE